MALALQPGFAQAAPTAPDTYTVTLQAIDSTVTGRDFGVVVARPDLVVTSVAAPSSGLVGREVTLSWTVENHPITNVLPREELKANTPIIGSWQDAIYLSSDPSLDAGDRLLAVVPHTGGLDANDTYTGHVTVAVPPVEPGNYFVIGRADRRSHEATRANNVAASGGTVPLEIPQLALGAPFADQFTAPSQDRYYQVTVAAGQSLVIALDSQAATGGTELYVRRLSLPTPYEFDFAARIPDQPDQALTVPTTQPGTYFVLARSRFGDASTSSFTVTASLPGFGIDSIDRSTGGNAGRVTLAIRGSGFTASTTARLVPTFAGPTLNGVAYDFRDATLLYATFDLTAQALGTYDVRIQDSGTATLPGAFQVVAGQADVGVELVTPRFVRFEREGYAAVEYVNHGNTDALAPVLQITADKAILRLLEQTEYVGGTLQFLGISTDGPAGILRPGQRGRVVIGFKSTTPIAHDLINFEVSTLPATPQTIDWAAEKAGARPSLIPADAWDAIWDNFTAEVGTTTADLQGLLAGNATYLSQLGIYTADVGRLMGFEVLQANAFQMGTALAGRVDAAYPTPGLSLGFSAVFLQTIAGRYRLGPMGRGWAHSWEISATEDATSGDVTVEFASRFRFFTRQTDGSYRGVPGDIGVLTRTNGVYQLREGDGTILRFQPDGKISFIQDTNGNRITAGYDGSGRLITLTHSSGPALTIGYNPQGRIQTVTDPAGRVTIYTYDLLNPEHLVSVTDYLGTRLYEYGTGHALTKITNIDSTEVNYQYDAAGRLIHIDRGPGAEPVNISYDAFAGVTREDAFTKTTTIFYNDSGQAELIRDPLGRQMQFNYDSAGSLLQTLSPTGLSDTYSYDTRGNLVRQVNPLGQGIEMNYDEVFNNLTRITDPNGNQTPYAYDTQGNLRTITYANGSQEQFSYDPLGSLTETINRRGNAIDYSHDPSTGLLTRKDFADGSYHEFTYDSRGNLTTARMFDSTATLTYEITMTYDPVTDELTRIDYVTDGRFLQFTYVNGRRTQSVDQDGFTVNYAYDAVGRLEFLRNGGNNLIVQYTYDAASRLIRKDLGNGTFTTYAYTDVGQLLSLVNHKDSVTINSQFDYTYDAEGRRTSMTLTDNDSGTTDGTTNYEYDAIGQLTRVTLPDGRTIEYQYDAAGNRIQVIDSLLGTTAYIANNLNQYMSVGGVAQTYDADGNLTSDGVSTYSWDDENQLLGVTARADTWTYQYDPFGNRRTSTFNGQTTAFLFDPIGLVNIASEYEGTGSLIAHYTHGLGLVSRTDPGGSAVYYDFDTIGSTTGITDSARAYVNRYTYLPFGQTTALGAMLPNPFTFVGQLGVSIEASGLFDMRFREYEPGAGQFLSDDPLGLGGGDTNFRRYAANQPLSLIDPSGTKCWCWYGPFGENPLVSGGPSDFVGLSLGASQGFSTGYSYGASAGASAGFSIGLGATAGVGPSVIAGPNLNGGIASAGAGLHAGLGVGVSADIAGFSAGASYGTSFGANLGYSHGSTTGVILGFGPCPDQPTGPWPLRGLPPFEVPFAGPLIHFPPATTEIVTPHDPNDITGPGGFGTRNFLTPTGSWPYTIHFENDPQIASAPAQEVFITDTLDPDLDWKTFQLGTFGFGSLTVEVPNGLQSYQTSIEYHNMDDSPLRVDVSAGLNLQTGVVTWTFRSIDPNTGQLPEGVFDGFLPVNDATGRGEGFVTYLVHPKADLVTGTAINAGSSIVFDLNAPVATNTFTNTIDSGPPGSSVAPLPTVTRSKDFTVSWSGSDDPGGSGIATFDVLVSTDGGPFTLFLDDTATTSATFHGEDGRTYRFFSVAADNVGHREPDPSGADAITVMDLNDPPGIASLTATPDPVPQGNALTLAANGATDPDGAVIKVEFFRDDNHDGIGQPDEKLGEDTNGTDGFNLTTTTVTWAVGEHTYLAQATDNEAGTSLLVGKTTTVALPPPEVNVLGNGVSIADGDSTPGTADGTDFGDIVQGQTGSTRTFTVRNDGSSPLTLGSVSLPAGFTLIEALSSSLAPGIFDTFTIQMDGTTPGAKSGEISFATNDSDENPFNFSIAGSVLPGIGVAIGDGAARALTYTEQDGTVVTVTLKGGTATVWLQGENLLPTAGKKGVTVTGSVVEIAQIALDNNTTAKSSLTFTTKGGEDVGVAMVGEISGNTPVGKLTGKGIDLGGIAMTGKGSVAAIDVHSILEGADLIMPGAGNLAGTTLKAVRIGAGTKIELGLGLKSLTAGEWSDGLLRAPWAAKIAIAGDFGVDLLPNGAGNPNQTLGSLIVKGNARGNARNVLWKIDGAVGTVNVAGWLDEIELRAMGPVTSVTAGGARKSWLFAGVKDTVQELPDSLDDFVGGVGAEIKGLTVKGIPGSAEPSFGGSWIAAPALGKVSLKGVASDIGGIAADRIKSYARDGIKLSNLGELGVADQKVVDQADNYLVRIV